jgi:tetratricopeptide (TPR) repeat protein
MPGALEECRLEFSLRKRARCVLFVVGMVLAVLALGYKVVRITIAATLGESSEPEEIGRAIALDPSNPEFYERLGLIYEHSPDLNAEESIGWLRKATALEPYNEFYWEKLALACDYAGEKSCANYSLARALRLSPTTPRLEWLAANHYLLTNNPERAFPHFRRLLELDPEYAAPTFAICLRAYSDPKLIKEHILPAGVGPELQLAYLNFLASREEMGFGDQLWSELTTTHRSFAFSLAEPYLERLIRLGQIDQAAKVWRDLERLRVIRESAEQETDNLVFNASFEEKPLNAGFDWRLRPTPYLRVDFADPSAYRGSRCLRIDFTVPQNTESEPIYQLIPALPGEAYVLKAHVRSAEITSDSGPRLRVVDPAHPECLHAATESTVGTTPWHEVSVNFSTCPETRLVRISIWRPMSRSFPPTISGHFWTDDVTVEPLGKASTRAASAAN